MAITETYVDPAIAGASGAGTVGDPYGDLQHALDTMTRDSTNGDRINIKAGTDEILGAAIDLSTYGTPDGPAPLVFQGYTTAAADGGIGGISGAATYSVINETKDYISFVDMHLHNSGSANIVQLDIRSALINCEIDNTTAHGCVLDTQNIVFSCYIHNCGGRGVSIGSGLVYSCYFENGANDFDDAYWTNNGPNHVVSCVFNLDGASNGINYTTYRIPLLISNNTIYSSSGTGTGILLGANSDAPVVVANNYVEGFSGAGGIGYDTADGSNMYLYSNRAYNNTTNFDTAGAVVDSDNSATAASALTNPGAGDFSVGTDLKAGAYPTSFKGTSTNQYMDIGAAQRQEPAGGAGGGRQGLHSIESGAV